jgi:DNA-binding GntR family transcriptional regulator
LSTDLSGITLVRDLRERRITADLVADALRQAIHRGELADGAELNQAAIAAHFGVSRVPVREAMRELQAEGLIEAQAHRRAVVRSLELDRLVEIYDLRALLEGYVVERATELITPSQLKELRVLERGMRDLEDHAAWLEGNAELHRRLYEPAGMVAACELIEQLRARAERYVRLWSGGAGLHRPVEAGREHVAILRLVARGDGPGARRAVEDHVRHTRDRLVAHSRAMAADGRGPGR